MRIRCLSGPLQGREWAIRTPKTLIGRDAACDIPLADPRISRFHAEIVEEGGHSLLRDLQSRNGSRVNFSEASTQLIGPGDRLTLGDAEFVLLEDGGPPQGVDWDLGQPSVRLAVPIDEACDNLGAPKAAPAAAAAAPAPPPPDETEAGRVQKRLRSLRTLFQLTRELTEVHVRDDLVALLERTIFQTFRDVERFCLLRREANGDYTTLAIRAREGVALDAFAISASILRRAEQERVGLLVADAAADTRFQASESIVLQRVRSALCAPLARRGEVVGALYLDNRRKRSCFDADDLNLISAFAGQVAVALHNAELYENVQRAYHQAVVALGNTLESRDPHTHGHTERTCHYALGIGAQAGLGQEQLKRLETAAQLHDIGKIGINDSLLGKAGRLSDTEFQRIQNHVLAGVRILTPIEYLRDALPIIRAHHERFDGAGYPDGLKGEQIPLEARILTVADAFDAMTTQRPYNKPLSFHEALSRCRESAGKQFDPRVVDALDRFLGAELDSLADPAAAAERGSNQAAGQDPYDLLDL
ncbi:MAG: HD domain-containing protein [Candidatus Sumerlaeota bacterium]|nr:HD domain-containing protein [Candidatus Sumerlaeota bacterium]